MRPGQKNRMRGGRNNNNGGRRGPNPLTRSYESNGPDVKVRGTPQHIAEKYVQLARDAHSAGDTVMAEGYLQHAEHYYRIIAAAQNAQQQAWNQANGVPQTETEPVEDEDEFEVAGADRFTFRTPQSFQQPQGGPPGQNGGYGGQPNFQQPQPYDTGAGEQPPMMEGQPQPAEGGQNNNPYQQQPPRGDRPFGNRRFDERNGRRFGRDRGDRNFGDRNYGDRQDGERPPHGDRQQGERQFGERQPGDRQSGDRNMGDRPERQYGDRRPPFQPRAEEAAVTEEAALPSFITGGSRGAPVAEAEASEPAGEMADAGGEGAFRRRRRRGPRPAAPEGQAGGGEE